jgi:hypothetical protein
MDQGDSPLRALENGLAVCRTQSDARKDIDALERATRQKE